MRHPRSKTRWTTDDVTVLVDGWCDDHIEIIAGKLGRTLNAVWLKAREMRLGGASSRYTSLTKASMATGWAMTTILRAAESLGIELHRLPRTHPNPKGRRGRNYGITDEQLDAIVAYLRARSAGRVRIDWSRTGEWGGPNKPEGCRLCGRSEVRHYARGLCRRCYGVQLRAGLIERWGYVRRAA